LFPRQRNSGTLIRMASIAFADDVGHSYEPGGAKLPFSGKNRERAGDGKREKPAGVCWW
jgi:hypothetical protein